MALFFKYQQLLVAVTFNSVPFYFCHTDNYVFLTFCYCDENLEFADEWRRYNKLLWTEGNFTVAIFLSKHLCHVAASKQKISLEGC